MTSCPYCGRENDDTLIRCRECGTELRPQTVEKESNSETSEHVRPFFCWRAASIILILQTILYTSGALLSVSMGRKYAQHGNYELARYVYWGTFWDVVIAILCALGRLLMSR